jgi:peroxin-12
MPRTTMTHFQVGVPYIRAKAQDYYEQLGGGVDSDILNDTPASQHLLTDGGQVGCRGRLRELPLIIE